MSFPLGSLQAGDGAAAPAGPASRWRAKAALLAGALAWLLFALAMFTHDAGDPAFTTSGSGAPLANKAGVLGARVSDLAFFLFGFSAWWLLPVSLRAWLAALARLLRGEPAPAPAGRLRVGAGLALLLCASTALEWTRLYRWEELVPGGHAGGVLGLLLGPTSMHWLGFAGSGVFWIALGTVGLALALRFSWVHVADAIGERVEQWREHWRTRHERAQDARLGEQAAREREAVVEQVQREQEEAPPLPLVIEPPVVEVPKSTRVFKEQQQPLFNELSETRLPQVHLLDAVTARGETITPESLEMTSRLIEKKLKDFGVEVRVVAASPGPVITRYEIEPATGVKGSQVVNLAKDLARSLSLVSIRVVEVVPGKNYMALELPNAKRQMIRLSEILGSEVYNSAHSMLTMGLGKDIVGNPVVADLAKMPHCLVAGTTGSGKSVGVNAMILSLLYKAEARDVRLILIDPKMLEMSVYEGIPHLLAPVVTDMKQAANALNWCVGEMERRYKLMSKLGVRNLAGYNRKIAEAAEKGEHIPNPFSLHAESAEAAEPLERLPHIVVVIDELADLMMVVGKKIEELIARLAQKARAAGLHLILATQRPSVDVITGLIKANMPARISFRVASRIDSRTILDQKGADLLLGQGDMLFLIPGTAKLVRAQGTYVSDEEVNRVTDFLCKRATPSFARELVQLRSSGEAEADSGRDGLFDQAVEIVLDSRRGSVSLLQRRLNIGYSRASRLIDQMAEAGIVGEYRGSAARDVIISREDWATLRGLRDRAEG
jgi:S-DNA-T family DNA segregation ATPase FtsK/SpoIIIE